MSRGFVSVNSDRIDLANEANFDFDLSSTFSVSCWWYSNVNVGGALVMKQESAVDFRGWGIFQRIGASGPTVALQLCDSTGVTDMRAFTTSEWSLNIWRSVVFTYNGNSLVSGCHIYINGVDQALTTLQDTLAGTMLNALECQIGCRGGSGAPAFFLDARVSGVGVWNVVLTQANVTTLNTAADPLGVRNANLIAYLPLCGVDSPEPDRKGTNNGTLTGTIRAENPPFAPWCQEQTDIGLLGRGAGW